MDSKQYINKVINLHDFSLKCYPFGQEWYYHFSNGGVDVIHLDGRHSQDKVYKNNFVISIVGHIYEHFINNLCVKKEEFWYLWDKIIFDINKEILGCVLHYRNKILLGYGVGNSLPYGVVNIFDNETILYLPTSEQIFGFFDMNRVHNNTMYFSYIEYNNISNTNMVKEITIPTPEQPQKTYRYII